MTDWYTPREIKVTVPPRGGGFEICEHEWKESERTKEGEVYIVRYRCPKCLGRKVTWDKK